MKKNIIIASIMLFMLGGLMLIVSCNNTLPSDPDEYIRVVRNGETTQWADESVDSDFVGGEILSFVQFGTSDLDVRYYNTGENLNATFPDPLPDVTGDKLDSDCTIVENTTDANYVTLSVTFNPAKDGYTSIECRAKKDW